MTRELRHEQIILNEAYVHFESHGDKIREHKGNDPHSSYDVLRGPLTRYAYGRLDRNWMDAEDCVQDAYVSVLETAKVNEFFNFGGLYKIWLDRAISRKRMEAKKRYEVIIDDQIVDEESGQTMVDLAISEEAPIELLLEVQTRVNNIMDASDGMKHKQKAIIRLILIYGYSISEVCKMVNVHAKYVSNVLSYFKKRL